MLKEIALSISTLVFFLCNFVVNSIAPSAPDAPLEPIVPEAVEAAVTSETFDLVGVWNSGGRVFEFTGSGKLLHNGKVMPYKLIGSKLHVTAEVDGTKRQYSLSFEPISARVLKLNGVTMYKVDE